ncbi:MAG: hypothetical protein U5K75_09890 [Ahrensia sp.]|nr:hypothetical protein [Ahrensia sp.]
MAARSLADPHFFDVGGQLSMADIVKRLKAMRRALQRMARPKSKSKMSTSLRAAYLAESASNIVKGQCLTVARKAAPRVHALCNQFLRIVRLFLCRPMIKLRAPP